MSGVCISVVGDTLERHQKQAKKTAQCRKREKKASKRRIVSRYFHHKIVLSAHPFGKCGGGCSSCCFNWGSRGVYWNRRCVHCCCYLLRRIMAHEICESMMNVSDGARKKRTDSFSCGNWRRKQSRWKESEKSTQNGWTSLARVRLHISLAISIW